jgi:hypothetical protein
VCQLVALTAEASVQLFSVLQLSPLEQLAAASAAPGAWDGGLRFGGSVRLLRSTELQLVSQQAGGPAGSASSSWAAGSGTAGLDRLLALAGGQQVSWFAHIESEHITAYCCLGVCWCWPQHPCCATSAT